MAQDRPDRFPENSSEQRPKPVSGADLEDQAKARAQAGAARAETENRSEPREALVALVMDHWEQDGDQTRCFGLTVPSEMIPEGIVGLLSEIEADYGLDILLEFQGGALKPGDVGALLETRLDLQAAAEANNAAREDLDAERAKTAVKEKEKGDYLTRVAELKASGKRNAELVDILAEDPAVPESEQVKWRAFRKILAIAGRVNPEDQAIITRRFNGLDVAQGLPSPVQFIQTAIFSGPDHDSGVSQATQNAIAAEFDLTPHRVVTGSDFEEAMNATHIGPDGEERPVYTEDEPLDFGLGVDGYSSDNGAQTYMRAIPTHGKAVTVDVTHLSPNGKALMGSYLGLWKVAEDAGVTDFFIDMTGYDLSGQAVVDEIALSKVAQKLNALLGGRTGYNGEIIRGDDTEGMIRWQAQLCNPKGASAQGDRDGNATRANMQGLGIMDAEGRIDFEVLAAFGSYSRDHWLSAPDYQAVKMYLAGLFLKKTDEKQKVAG